MRLLCLACEHGRLEEIPLPTGIVVSQSWLEETKKSSASSRLRRLADAYQRIVAGAKKLERAEAILDAFASALDSDVPESASGQHRSSESQQLLRSSLAPSYESLRSVLESSASWNHFKSHGPMVRVFRPPSRAGHWVRRAHLPSLRAAGFGDTAAEFGDTAGHLERPSLWSPPARPDCLDRLRSHLERPSTGNQAAPPSGS